MVRNVMAMLPLAAVLSACGGSGGSSSSDTDVIEYTGSTSAAHLTGVNANVFVADIMSGIGAVSVDNQVTSIRTKQSPRSIALPGALRSLGGLVRRGATQSSSGWAETLMSAFTASVSVNETLDCDAAGSLKFTGTLNDDGTGTLNLQFDDCDDGTGVVTDGSGTLRIDSFDSFNQIILDSTLQTDALNWKSDTEDLVFSGTMREQVNLDDSSDELTINAVIVDQATTRQVKWENFSIVSIYDNYLLPTTFTEAYLGRIYDSVEGYVDVATTFPLIYSDVLLEYPDGGGPIELTGDGAGKALFFVPSSNKVRIEVDADDDDIFESSAVYAWSNLAVPAANTPPVGTVAISPSSPQSADTLTTDLTAYDVDGDPLTFTFSWSRNGTTITDEHLHTLSPDHFAKGDIVEVTATLSDGTTSVVMSAEVTIGDTPPAIDPIASLGATYGTPVDVQISASDPDNDPVTYELVYGPAGMLVDSDGRLSWTPSGPMFDESLEVHYEVRALSGESHTDATGSITVTDPGHPRPLARSALAIPDRADGIHVADFNGDGKTEILITDNIQLLYTLVLDGDEYVQDWVYPFDLALGQSIASVATHDINNDGKPDILVGTGNGITIMDGVSRSVIGSIDDGHLNHNSIHVADVNNDGQPDIVYIGDSDAFQSAIYIYNAGTLQLEWQSPSLELGNSLALGNVDHDSALEIVTANGYVYDGASYINEWAYGPGFGSQVATGDVDGDGVDEIIGGGLVTVFSATTKAPLWEIPVTAQTIVVQNIDNDPQDEIIVGDPSSGIITAYDGATGAGVVQWSIDAQNYGVSSIAVGDTDNDAELEFVWTAGVQDSGPDSIAVAGLNPAIQIEWTNGTETEGLTGQALLQLNGPYVGGRWLTVEPATRRVLFSSIESNAGYTGTRLVSIDPASGTLNTSLEVGSNWSDAMGMDGADYDNDGIDEVFLGTSDLYDGYAMAYDFANDFPEWSSQHGLGTSRIVEKGDLDNDGSEDLILLTTDGYIYAYSPATSTLLWKSAHLPDFYSSDIEVADIDGDGDLEIIAMSFGTSGYISVFEKQGTDYLLSHQIILDEPDYSIRDGKLAISDLNGDGHPEIVVALSTYTSPDTALRIYGSTDYQLVTGYAFPGAVTELAPEPDGSGNLLLATVSDYFFVATSRLQLVHGLTGGTIWTSPAFIGQVQPDSLSYADVDDNGSQELIFGTSRVMYISR
jgi:hypothetical protein